LAIKGIAGILEIGAVGLGRSGGQCRRSDRCWRGERDNWAMTIAKVELKFAR
jgi:hypothetical protein